MVAARSATSLFAGLALVSALGCGNGAASNGSGSTTVAVSAEPSAPPASASVVAAPPDDTIEGTGYKAIKPVSDAALGCKQTSFEMATYLLRGELTLAGRPANGGEVAGSWLVQLRGKAQIAFAGFDAQARRIGRDRGIGNAKEHAPSLFATGDAWTVVWFDDQGLAFAHPAWETLPTPDIEHLSAVKGVDPANVALGATPDGSLVVASPFGTQGDQLSVFVFGAPGTKPQALGVTKFAKHPSSPAVSADADGYTVVWTEEGGVVHATRFDKAGKEIGDGAAVIRTPAEKKSLQLVSIADATMLVWSEGDAILARKLGKDGHADSKIRVVAAKGKFPLTMGAGSDAVVAFLGEADGVADQLLAARLSAEGVAETAYRVSDGKLPVADP
ncbi:MAG TPA: hypothetical protein VL400_23555, partial [Polyangiaceae bacterium]|nr:hypothetical protein [Polyangiaceae bacterium]